LVKLQVHRAELGASALSQRRPVRDTPSQIRRVIRSGVDTCRKRPGRDITAPPSPPVPVLRPEAEATARLPAAGRRVTSPPECPRSPAVPAEASALAPIGRDVTPPRTPASGRGTHAAAPVPPPGTRVCREDVGAGAIVADDGHGTAHRTSSAVLPPQGAPRTTGGTRSTASPMPSLRDPSRRMDATTRPRHILREGVDQFRRSEVGQFWRVSKAVQRPSGVLRACGRLHTAKRLRNVGLGCERGDGVRTAGARFAALRVRTRARA
jgi:hypothetical protein